MQDLADLIASAKKILITSHTSPDPDAVCSILLLSTSLAKNFPDKSIVPALEETPSQDLRFLIGYDRIIFSNLDATINTEKPDLIFIVDANKFSRCSRTGSDQIESHIANNAAKTIIIDHHEPHDRLDSDLYINQNSPACTQDVYEVCFDQLGLDKPEGYADTALMGIVSDTARFKYDNPRHEATFKVVNELLNEGSSIEAVEAKLAQYSIGCMQTIAELIKNIKIEDAITISYISDEFTQNMVASNISFDDIKNACDIFNGEFMRSIDGSKWGYIIYPQINMSPKTYSVSFRSLSDIRDVSEIAAKLGGGGHKPAAGAKIQAESVQAALQIVKEAL